MCCKLQRTNPKSKISFKKKETFGTWSIKNWTFWKRHGQQINFQFKSKSIRLYQAASRITSMLAREGQDVRSVNGGWINVKQPGNPGGWIFLGGSTFVQLVAPFFSSTPGTPKKNEKPCAVPLRITLEKRLVGQYWVRWLYVVNKGCHE